MKNITAFADAFRFAKIKEKIKKEIRKVFTTTLNSIGKLFFSWGIFIKIFIAICALYYTNEIIILLDKFVLPKSFQADNGVLFTLTFALFAFLGICFYLYAYIKKYRPNRILNWTIIILSAYHFYFRIIDTKTWHYFSLIALKSLSLAYLDLVFIILIAHLILLYRNSQHKIKEETNTSILSMDQSYSEKKKDELYRTELVEQVAEQITSLKASNSFAIGIVGEWGFGKTYFIDMLKEELKQKGDFLIVQFNPWKSSGSGEKTLLNFFDTLKSDLSKYDGNVSKKINSYIKKLVQIDKTGIIEEALSTDISLQDEFDNIEKCIKRIAKKVIVFVDDLDRLDSDEIIEVLKLIRNNASFANTVFIAGYDKTYLTHALSKINTHLPHIYLEKIFQLEIPLPIIRKEVIKKKFLQSISTKTPALKEGFEVFLNKSDHNLNLNRIFSTDSNIPEARTYSNLEAFVELVTNFRDIDRLQNFLSINYNLNLQEIVLADALILNIIRIKNQAIYEEIKRKSFLDIRYIEQTNQSVYAVNTGKLDLIFTRLNLSIHSKDVYQTLLNIMFSNIQEQARNSLKIVDSFDLYFDITLFDKVSLIEFNAVRKSNGDFKDAIDRWIKAEKKDDLIEIIKKIDAYNNKHDFENIISAIFYLGELTFYHINDLLPLFNKNKLSEISRLYYNGEDDVLKTFFKDKLTTSKFENDFTSLFLHHIIREQIYQRSELYFTLGEMQAIAITRLKEIIAYHTPFSVGKEEMLKVFQFYYLCIDEITSGDNKIIILNEANACLRAFIEEHPNGFIEFNIRPVYTPHDGETYTLEPFILQIFGSYTSFESFLNNQKEVTSHLLELITFYNEFKRNNYQVIKYVRGSIRIISDELVSFTGSSTHKDLQAGNAVIFITDLWKKLQTTSLKYSNLIAHTYPITPDEANEGGTYSFELKFMVPEEIVDVANTFEIYVDDYITITLNDEILVENFHGKNEITFKQHNLKLLKGNNTFQFVVRNVSKDEIDPKMNDLTGYTNPYGLIFCLSLLDNNIKRSEL